MLNLSDQHRIELDQAREQVADECRSRARSDSAAYEQMIAELQLNILIADTVRRRLREFSADGNGII